MLGTGELTGLAEVGAIKQRTPASPQPNISSMTLLNLKWEASTKNAVELSSGILFSLTVADFGHIDRKRLSPGSLGMYARFVVTG